jgi:hypothetical protein
MEGAGAAMRKLPPELRPIMICNELTPLSRVALAEKTSTMVINTPLRAISREVGRMMAQTLGAKSKGRVTDGFLPFEVLCQKASEPIGVTDRIAARSGGWLGEILVRLDGNGAYALLGESDVLLAVQHSEDHFVASSLFVLEPDHLAALSSKPARRRPSVERWSNAHLVRFRRIALKTLRRNQWLISLLQRTRPRRSSPGQDGDTRASVLIKPRRRSQSD